MIKNIVKRNGSVEEFSPSKINGWGEWAAKTLNGHVDWASVVIETVNACPETCTSIELQKKLIEVCLARKSWEYNRMAGRLYASLICREIYGDDYPTVKQVHQKLYEAGLMVRLNYTDDEYAEVEKMIDGGLRNISIGYQIHEVEEDRKAGEYRAVDYEVYEISVVTTPADSSIGIGRVQDNEARTVRVRSVSQPAASAASLEDKSMSEQQATAPQTDIRCTQTGV